MSDAGLMAMMAYSAGLLAFFTIIFLVLYVLKSIGLMTMAANKGIENAWLAWIPAADLYIAGSILGEMDVFGNRLDNLGLWLPVVMIGGCVLAIIPFIGIIFSLAMMLFFLLFAYNLFNLYSPEQATLYTILSIFGLWAIFIFILRNNQPVSNNNLQV
jgi:hypothetical protein